MKKQIKKYFVVKNTKFGNCREGVGGVCMNPRVMDLFMEIIIANKDLSYDYADWVKTVQDVKSGVGHAGLGIGFSHQVVPFLRERFVIEKFGSIEAFLKQFEKNENTI